MEEKLSKIEKAWTIYRIIHHRVPLILATLAIYFVGMTFFFLIFDPSMIGNITKTLNRIINNYPEIFSTFIIISLFSAVTSISIYGRRIVKKDKNHFLEIDEKKTRSNEQLVIKLSSFLKVDGKKHEDLSAYNDFYSYFWLIIAYLDNQIDASDQKASVLLQSGKRYIIAGIVLYIIAIIIWQALLHSFNFDFKYIYGILGSSLLFIFIEFFGGWFLRQYKQFVDTSTYLIKIKSILQRYILAYLALKDAKEKEFEVNQLISMLQEEIKWPESYLLKKPDVNFAKECLETATNLINSLQINNKNQGEK